MRTFLTLACLSLSVSPAYGSTWRDNPSARFAHDIRSNSENLRARLNGNQNHIKPHNARLRERLHGTGRSHDPGPRLRRSD